MRGGRFGVEIEARVGEVQVRRWDGESRIEDVELGETMSMSITLV